MAELRLPDWDLVALGVFVVVFSGWMLYEHRRISDVDDVARRETQKVAADSSARHLDTLGAMAHLAAADHSHPFWVHAHDEYHAPLTHDHPHQHEHVQHVHTLVKLSEHEDTGTRVIVKKCENCGTIFRDRGEALVNGRTQ